MEKYVQIPTKIEFGLDSYKQIGLVGSRTGLAGFVGLHSPSARQTGLAGSGTSLAGSA
jgi:hypothetical protein